MEGCLAEMEQANINLAKTFRWAQERLFAEDKELNRRRLEARLRAQIPQPQTKLTPAKKGKPTKERETPEPVDEGP